MYVTYSIGQDEFSASAAVFDAQQSGRSIVQESIQSLILKMSVEASTIREIALNGRGNELLSSVFIWHFTAFNYFKNHSKEYIITSSFHSLQNSSTYTQTYTQAYTHTYTHITKHTSITCTVLDLLNKNSTHNFCICKCC